MPDVLVRPRRDGDVPALVDLLFRQQPETRYPFHWPPDRAPEDFLRRPTEREAWVAEIAGVVVGHVAIQSVAAADELGEVWATAHGEVDSASDVEIIASGDVGGGIAFSIDDLARIFAPLALVEGRAVRSGVDGAFAESFLGAALFARREG